jgi:lipopolysaccharide export system permease protein
LLTRFVHATSAVQVDGAWQLENLRESTFARDVSENRQIASEPWSTAIDPRQIRSLWLEPHDLSFGELRRAIRLLRAQGQNPLAHEVAFWRRVTAPVYMGVMVLLAVPLVLVSGRTVRIGERVTLGALVGLGFQMLQSTFTNLGIVAGFPPLVTALVPALMAMLAVTALFRWQRPQ